MLAESAGWLPTSAPDSRGMGKRRTSITVPVVPPTPRFGVKPTKREAPRKGRIPRKAKHKGKDDL